MHPVLDEAIQRYGVELADKPTEWCQRHPGQDDRQWCAQALIEHLVLTARSTSRLLEKRLQKGKSSRARATAVQRLLQFAVLTLGRMPSGAPAPSFARPGAMHWAAMSGAELMAQLRDEFEHMDKLLDATRERLGLQRVGVHFLLGPLRSDQWRRLHTVHLRHHLAQLDRIARSVGPVSAVRADALPV